VTEQIKNTLQHLEDSLFGRLARMTTPVFIAMIGWFFIQMTGTASKSLDAITAMAESNRALIYELRESTVAISTTLAVLGNVSADQETRVRALEAWQTFVNRQGTP